MNFKFVIEQVYSGLNKAFYNVEANSLEEAQKIFNNGQLLPYDVISECKPNSIDNEELIEIFDENNQEIWNCYE